ncbi:DUF397 domain-containing protein [Streptomyces olivaceus]|uniref:DUF397 domain-containing protein n=1 Tax=Streptomyces olivaceus TaxID=47716 RepID=UPI0033B617DF
MADRVHWRKSSYSGGGDGNACVEVASGHPRVGIRDSKTPGEATLNIPAAAFTAFVEALKNLPGRP